jgi:hypothetical protein
MRAKNISLLSNHLVQSVLGISFVLLIPLAAMQFSDDVNWGREDFIAIAILLYGATLIYELFIRKLRTKNQRLIAGVLVVLLVLYLWAELAVGIFTHWGS